MSVSSLRARNAGRGRSDVTNGVRNVRYVPSTNVIALVLRWLMNDRKGWQCFYAKQFLSKHHNPELLQNQHVFRRVSPTSSSQTLSPTIAQTSDTGYAPSSQNVDFPPVFFLDFKTSQKYHTEIPKAPSSIPTYVSSVVADVPRRHSIAKLFFETVHQWLPII